MVSSSSRLFLGGILLTLLLFLSLDRIKPQTGYHISSQERLLSYVPPILETSSSETLSIISIKKINVFDDDAFDKVAVLEQYQPVIDSVIVIPKGFHAFENGALV